MQVHEAILKSPVGFVGGHAGDRDTTLRVGGKLGKYEVLRITAGEEMLLVEGKGCKFPMLVPLSNVACIAPIEGGQAQVDDSDRVRISQGEPGRFRLSQAADSAEEELRLKQSTEQRQRPSAKKR